MMDTSKAVAQNRLTIKSVRQAWLTSTRKRTTTAGIISQAIEALAHPVPVQARPHDGPRYIMETDASDAGWGATVYRVMGARAPKQILGGDVRGHLSSAPPPRYQRDHPLVRFNTDSMGPAERQRQADYQCSGSPGNNLPRQSGYLLSSRAYTGSSQHQGRLSVQAPRPGGLPAQAGGLPAGVCHIWGSTKGRPIRQQIQSATQPVLQQETRPEGAGRKFKAQVRRDSRMTPPRAFVVIGSKSSRNR